MPLIPKKTGPYYTTQNQSVKTYIANLTQTSTDAPTKEVQKNTIGPIISEYDNVGGYKLTSSDDLFTEEKTTVIINQSTSPNNAIIVAYWQGSGIINIETWENQLDGTYVKANNYLDKTTIIITVYP